MKALSIRQPWAWLIVQGFKDVENRERRCAHRGPLLIHAASWITPADYEACRIFVAGFSFDIVLPAIDDLPRGGIVGQVVLLDCVNLDPIPWFTGPYGYVLADARPCDLIRWRGMPGLFEVDLA